MSGPSQQHRQGKTNQAADRPSPESPDADPLHHSEQARLCPRPKQASSWDDLLTHARRRLAERASGLSAPFAAGPAGSLLRRDPPHTLASDSLDRAQDDSDPQKPQRHEASLDPEIDHPEISELAASFRRLPAVGSDSRGRLSRFLQWRGMLASALAHVVILFLLAFVTLSVPDRQAGLAFQSAVGEKPPDVIELTPVLQAEAPEATEAATEVQLEPDSYEPLAQVTIPVSQAAVSQAIGALSQPITQDAAAALRSQSQSISASLMANASFFGAAAGGNNFCYVIDASGSMKGGPWEAARAELLKSIGSLKPKQRFYIVMYTRQIEAIPLPGEDRPAAHHLYATAENLEHARRWLMSVRVGGGGAAPKEALSFAIAKEPDAIYLLTDGVTSVRDVASSVRRENRVQDLIHGEQVKVPIHTIAFYTLDGERLLRQLAHENGGQFIYVPKPGGTRR